MPKWLEAITGSPAKTKRLPTMGQNQLSQFNNAVNNPIEGNQTYQAGNSFLQKILSGDPSAYEAFENPYIENFQQKILPMIGERFAGLGTGSGALSSSALNNSLGEAGRGLQTDLAGLRAGLQQNAAGQALNYSQQPYNNAYAQAQVPTFAYGNQPRTPGLIENIGGPLLQGAGTAFGAGPLATMFGGMFGGGQQSKPGFGMPGANVGRY